MQHSSTQELIKSIIQRIAVGPNRGKNINQHEAYEATMALLNNKIDPVQAAIFLIGLRMKRESIGEYKGIFQALQESIETTTTELQHIVYLAEPYDGYSRHLPMSPFVPAVLAACGLPCIIQGVRSVGPKHGVTAHQVYAEYEIPINVNIQLAQQPLESKECGWTYLDQSVVAPKLYNLQTFRDQIIKRTALTTLERLALPIKAPKTSLVIGYVHKAYPEIYASIAKQAGFIDTLLIKGIEGGITPALNKPLRSFFTTKDQPGEKQIKHSLSIESQSTGVKIDPSSKNSLAKQTLDAGLQALQGEQGDAHDSIALTCTSILESLLPKYDGNRLEQVTSILQSGIASTHFNALRTL